MKKYIESKKDKFYLTRKVSLLKKDYLIENGPIFEHDFETIEFMIMCKQEMILDEKFIKKEFINRSSIDGINFNFEDDILYVEFIDCINSFEVILTYIESKYKNIKSIYFNKFIDLNLNLWELNKFENIDFCFQYCTFKKIYFEDKNNYKNKSVIKNILAFSVCKIEKFKLNGVIFEKEIQITKSNIDLIEFHYIRAKDEFRFHLNCRISILKIQYSTFEQTLFLNNIIFIENAEIKYSFFENNITFINSIFEKNIDISTTLFSKSPSFLNIKIFGNYTNRETYRIIKQSFLSVGNKIEANKFYSKEMEAREKEFKKDKDTQKIYLKNEEQNISIKKEYKDIKLFSDYLIFKIYKYTSNFSQNPLLVLFWIIFFELILSGTYASISNKFNFNSFSIFIFQIGIVYLLIIYLYFLKSIKVIKYFGYLIIAFIFYRYVSINNSDYFFNFINILQPKESSPELGFFKNFIFYINKMILGYLMYQFLISVRKDTKEL